MRKTWHSNASHKGWAPREEWPPGIWQTEPDKVQWVDEATGLDCVIVRNGSGSLCGYVGVPSSHPLYKKEYNDEGFPDLDVHGGVTYTSGHRIPADGDYSDYVSFEPYEGFDPDLWIIGFDCSHAGDLSPGLRAHRRSMEKLIEEMPGDTYTPIFFKHWSEDPRREVYWTIEQVETEVGKLAAQVAELSHADSTDNR